MAGVNKKELYFMFHFKNEFMECTGDQIYPNCTTVGDNTTDYSAIYGYQSYEGVINANPNIGSFTVYNGMAYYLYNTVTNLKVIKSCNRYYNPMPPSTADGLSMANIEDNFDIDMFKLVNNSTDINGNDMIYDNKCDK